MKKIRLMLVLFIIVALAFYGCKKKEEAKTSQPAQTEEFKRVYYGDMLVVASFGEPLNLIPALATDSASHEVADQIYNGLVKYDKDLQITGSLAESWEILDEGKTIIFHLRKDVKWHDGEPFTAEDVIFTYKFMIDDNTPTSYDSKYRIVDSVEASDDYTVKVKYKEAYAPALISWGIWIMPKHLLSGVVPTKSPLQRHPIGTGPYRFESWQPGQHITLRANYDYFEGRPKLELMKFKYLEDQTVGFLELLKGTVDLMKLTPAQYVKQSDTERFKNSYDKYSYIGRNYSFIGYNLTRKPFDDKRVRQALSLATPKEQIISSVEHGISIATTGPYKPDTYWYNPNVVQYDYDLEKASKLLSEAGYTKNNKGQLVKNGKQLKITLMTNQNPLRVQMAEIIQQSWNKLGINVDIRVLEWGAFISEHVEKRNFDAVILAWNTTLDPDPSDVWHSKSCSDKKTLNFICFKNAEVDKLLEEGNKTFDLQVRKDKYDRFQEILAEEQPYTFLYVAQTLFAISNRIEAIEPAPAGIYYNLIDWYVKKENQKYNVIQ